MVVTVIDAINGHDFLLQVFALTCYHFWMKMSQSFFCSWSSTSYMKYNSETVQKKLFQTFWKFLTRNLFWVASIFLLLSFSSSLTGVFLDLFLLALSLTVIIYATSSWTG